jgi:hypothetical protein
MPEPTRRPTCQTFDKIDLGYNQLMPFSICRSSRPTNGHNAGFPLANFLRESIFNLLSKTVISSKRFQPKESRTKANSRFARNNSLVENQLKGIRQNIFLLFHLEELLKLYVNLFNRFCVTLLFLEIFEQKESQISELSAILDFGGYACDISRVTQEFYP